MAKRKKTDTTAAPMMPSPKEQMRWSAESIAESAVRNHPKFKKMRDHITSAVMKATGQACRNMGKKGDAE